MKSSTLSLAICAITCLLAIYSFAPATGAAEEQLIQHRNLGKAFYENPTTQAEAVAEFKKALDLKPDSIQEQLNYGLALLRAAKTREAVAILEQVQKRDPKLPHTWFNLGIYYKKEGEFDKALQQLQEMARLVPGEAITHYNLGTIYKLQGKTEDAQKEFEKARDLNPGLAAPHFQLFNLYRQAGRADDAKKELVLFNARKQVQDSATPEDVEWCDYAEVYEPLHAEPDLTREAVAYAFTPKTLADISGDHARLLTLDAFGTGQPDLLAYSSNGVTLYKSGMERVTDSGLDGLRDLVAVKAGDFNNDGLADLCVLTRTGAALFENKKGRFAKASVTLPAGEFNNAVWIDFDHDYDLDLMLLGKKSTLLRNQGAEGFAPHPFPFVEGEALDGIAFRVMADSKSKDLLVSYKDRPATLYLDQLTATYTAAPFPQVPAGATHLESLDLTNDSNLDIVYVAQNGLHAVLNQRGQFQNAIQLAAADGIFADFGNRGWGDLISAGQIKQNVGKLEFIAPKSVSGLPKADIWATADFDGDGRVDLAAITTDNKLALLQNNTATKNRWLRVQIAGVKNLKLPLAAEIEVKAGRSYQKKIYDGTPVLFGLGTRNTVDTIRITWPNGLIQNEMKQAVGKNLSFKEAQRLSGSCPLIFIWNGREFQYVTDVLGVAPLGAMSGDGQFFPTNHVEYISLNGDWLAPRNGQYEIRLTEELSEVSYFDHVSLIAVDHPASTEIFSNDKWKSPPFPDFRLYGSQQRIYPTHARSKTGDVQNLLLRQDRRYVDDFQRNYTGVAEKHTLDLGFGNAAKENRAFLVLNGWVDWADGSTFLAQAQERRDLTPPYLQVKNKQGNWVTVIDDMGMPSGKPKTIAVDLTGKFLSDSREVRIVTNMCVFWDEIFLSEDARTPQNKLTELSPARADIRFRGFSPSHIHPERKQPEYFDFVSPTPTSFWNPTPGMYTRYGEVTELMASTDDRLVIIGSGDEVTLRFDPKQFPALPTGWRRDYLLRVEGWAKDRDANTAYSQTVEPLPFHGMSRYPYPSSERYPDDEFHNQYRRKYNTRPALRLLRPLAATTE